VHLVDELFSEIKILGFIRDLEKCPSEDRWFLLSDMVRKLNVFKGEMSALSYDEQLYLGFKIQEKGIDMGLCPNFYMFFSSKNNKFHHTCKARKKERTSCRGKVEKCDKGIFKKSSGKEE